MANQISVGLALALIGMVKPPNRIGVYDLRRQARYRGIKSWDGKGVGHLRRHELLEALAAHGGPQ